MTCLFCGHAPYNRKDKLDYSIKVSDGLEVRVWQHACKFGDRVVTITVRAKNMTTPIESSFRDHPAVFPLTQNRCIVSVDGSNYLYEKGEIQFLLPGFQIHNAFPIKDRILLLGKHEWESVSRLILIKDDDYSTYEFVQIMDDVYDLHHFQEDLISLGAPVIDEDIVRQVNSTGSLVDIDIGLKLEIYRIVINKSAGLLVPKHGG